MKVILEDITDPTLLVTFEMKASEAAELRSALHYVIRMLPTDSTPPFWNDFASALGNALKRSYLVLSDENDVDNADPADLLNFHYENRGK